MEALPGKFAICCAVGAVPGADDRPVVVVNPLDGALHHYAEALAIALSSSGSTAVAQLATVEPSRRTDSSRLRWLKDYVRLLRSARRLRPARLIVTWPVLGYWDFLLVRLLLPRRRTWIVLHDPRPLVYARGYGRFARRLASVPAMRSQVIVHSEAARACVAEDASPRRLDLLPLPLKPESPSIAAVPTDRPVVRVLGQFKADRDVAALERLAAEAPADWTFEVVGRKWPDISGWHVTSRFVSEEEFDELIDTANVIVIPYRRFFQSDVAIRALEHSTPVVGPRQSSLAELLGSASPWLVDEGSWLPAVSSAIAGGTDGARAVAEAERARVVLAWEAWGAE